MRSVCAKLQESMEDAIFEFSGNKCIVSGLEDVLNTRIPSSQHPSKIFFEVKANPELISPFCVVEIEQACEDPEFKLIGKNTYLSLNREDILQVFKESRLSEKVKNKIFTCNFYEVETLQFYPRMGKYYNELKFKDNSNPKFIITLWIIKKEGAEKYHEIEVNSKEENKGNSNFSSIILSPISSTSIIEAISYPLLHRSTILNNQKSSMSSQLPKKA